MKQDHTFRLEDGRTLSYALYGPRDGNPVFFFHGLPSCRLEAAGISSSGLLDQVGVNLIVPDRPGFGRSTPAPGRTILGYTHDVEALSDHLGLSQHLRSKLESEESETSNETKRTGYGIVGGSGGGPYALACAQVASQSPDRFRNLRRVGVFAGAPPFVPPVTLSDQLGAATSAGDIDNKIRNEITSRHEEDTKILQRDWMIKSKLMFGLAVRFPSLSRAISSAGINTSSRLYRNRLGQDMFDRYLKAWLRAMAEKTTASTPSKATTADTRLENEKDPNDTLSDAVLDHEVAAFVSLARETWAQGADGWVEEAGLLGRAWGFDPCEIRCGLSTEGEAGGIPVKVWHGSQDVNAPLASMRWLVDRIPGAELVVLEDKGHFELGHALEEMLEWASTR